MVVIIVASALGAGIKGVTGLGYPIIAIPLIALALGIEDAVVIVAVPNLAANAYLCFEARDARHETRDLPRLVTAGILGSIIGTIALVHLPETPLLLALAATVVAFVVLFLREPELQIPPATSRRWSPVAGGLAGLMQGSVGVSGPVVATWLHGYRLGPRPYVYAITLIFGITGATQLVVLLGQGAFDRERVVGAAIAAVPVAIMTPVGLALRARLAGPAFERAVLVVLAASAASLVVRVVA